MDAETRFYVALAFIIFLAVIIGYLAISNYQAPVTQTIPWHHGFKGAFSLF